MNDVLRALLVVIVLFGAYWSACVARYHYARLRARFGPFRGVRIVYRRDGRARLPVQAAAPHLRLVSRNAR